MKKLSSLFFVTCFMIVLSSCEKEESCSQESDEENLREMLSEIHAMAKSVPCTNADDWTYTGYGSKPCGGPQGYIAYSNKIDTVLFLQKVEEHRQAEQDYNEKWGGFSDCSVPVPPSTIMCVDGDAIMVW